MPQVLRVACFQRENGTVCVSGNGFDGSLVSLVIFKCAFYTNMHLRTMRNCHKNPMQIVFEVALIISATLCCLLSGH